MAGVTTNEVPAARRLYRLRDGRVVAGVASGLADHLGVDVLPIRVAFVLLVMAGGLGVALYAVFWAVVPMTDDRQSTSPSHRTQPAQLLILGGLGLGVLFVAQLLGLGAGVLWSAVAAAAGAAILWRQADDAQRARWRAATTRLPRLRDRTTPMQVVLRTVFGMVLVVGGVIGFLAAHRALAQARSALVPILVIVLGVAMVAGPLILRTVRELTEERRARIREQERAEFAARVHDSVLQTLTLIQRNAADPATVLRLARGSEREVRGWLYHPPGSQTATLRAGLEREAASVEDEHGVTIDVVTVGDAPSSPRVEAVVQAAREALVNAAKASGTTAVSVYAEVTGGRIQVYVRDRGRGFDLAAVPADRYGIRESIVGRMARHGGAAEVRTAPGAGTEVRLDLPLPETTQA